MHKAIHKNRSSSCPKINNFENLSKSSKFSIGIKLPSIKDNKADEENPIDKLAKAIRTWIRSMLNKILVLEVTSGAIGSKG